MRPAVLTLIVRGIVRDIEGNSYEVGPGDVVYGPPGMRGAHEWEVKETLQLLAIKATNAPERAIQFNVDRSTACCLKLSIGKPLLAR